MTDARDIDLALLTDRFMRRIHFGLQARAPDFDRKAVGPGGGIVLMTLAETGRVAINDLTKLVARDKSQMTRTLRGLEEKGLLLREPCPDDRRVTFVSLTSDGEKVVGELMATIADVIGGILEPISASERKTLKELLNRALA